MGRKRRRHLPGAIFHITARTQGREPWFTPILRDRLVDYTAAVIGSSDARLLAFAIMPNHLHLVIQQGQWTLGRVMQPLLRRAALLVQRSHGVEGHVFERRFGDRPCLDPDYARAVIAYTHLNPVRARLTDRAEAYAWSSHRYYVRPTTAPEHLARALASHHAIRLFAERDHAGSKQLRRAYTRYIEWREQLDAARAVGEATHASAPGESSPVPLLLGGDLCWARQFSPFVRASAPGATSGDPADDRPRPDLSDIARRTLADHSCDLRLADVRSSCKQRAVVAIRRVMVRRMDAAGHPGAAIARYLNISDQAVSHILNRDRWAGT